MAIDFFERPRYSGTNLPLASEVPPNARNIATTAPLTGGGNLSADRTLAISAATTGAAGSMSAADKAKSDAFNTNSYYWMAYQSSAQTNLVVAGTKLTFTTLQNAAYDGGGNYSTGTSYFTVPASGLYLVGGGLLITPGTTATTGQYVRLFLSVDDGNTYLLDQQFPAAGTNVATIFVKGSALINVAASSTLSLRCLHTLTGTGATLPDTVTGQGQTYFWGSLLRGL